MTKNQVQCVGGPNTKAAFEFTSAKDCQNLQLVTLWEYLAIGAVSRTDLAQKLSCGNSL